ncbi:MAG: OmpA family protein [Gammaproteobacteria bacterium]|jgi:chemotaxis protein MotB|nr:OmpA family protein [Gammaproteobacteria bacterium]
MNQSNANQKILGVSGLILAILVLVGWYFYDAQQKRLQSLADESQVKAQMLSDALDQSNNEVTLLNQRMQQLAEDLSTVRGSLTDEQRSRLQLQAELVQTTTDKNQIEQSLQQQVQTITATTAQLEQELQRQLSLQEKLNDEIDQVSSEKGQLRDRLEREQQNQLRLQQQIARVMDDVAQKEAALANAEQEAARLSMQLSETREEQALLEKRVEKLKQQREMDARHFSELEDRLKRELNESRVEISQFKDRMTVIKLTSEVLFNSGSAEIQPSGQKVLALIARSLKAYPDRAISIEGHTDSVPIGKHSSYVSNWELSTARALAAVNFFRLEMQMDPQRLQVVGHGEFQPVASNQTARGRQLNRRIEIRLMPEAPIAAEQL